MDYFPETVEIKIPCTVTERRKIAQCAYNEVYNIGNIDDNNSNDKNHLNQEINTENNDDVDNIADRLTGLPVFALFVEAYRRLLNEIDEKKLKEFSSSAECLLGNGNDSSKQDKVNMVQGEIKSNNSRKIKINSVSDGAAESSNVSNNRDSGRLSHRNSVSFPCVYGQKEAKRAITECLLWPKLYHKLFSVLSPGGEEDSLIECTEYCPVIYHLLICLFVYLFVCLFVCLFIYFLICLFQ